MVKGQREKDGLQQTEDLNQQEIEELEKGLKDAFLAIRNDTLGSMKDSSEEDTEFMIKCLQEFTDWSVTCSIKDPATKNIVEEVNKHQHFEKSCKRKNTECRFGFPRFPTTETIIAIPSRILYKDDLEKEKEMLKKSNDLKQKVIDVLNDKSMMEQASKHRIEEINEYIKALRCIEDLKKVRAFKKYKKYKNRNAPVDLIVTEEIMKDIKRTQEELMNTRDELLAGYEKAYQEYKMVKHMKVISKERLDIVLVAANIAGETPEERFQTYKEALQISDWGYSTILKRDVDEVMINNYNKEFIAAWNANMDLQICLDFFAVLTYVTDYTYNDESGTTAIIKQALENSNDPILQNRMRTILHTYLTTRQAGGPEVLYRMLPFLHLTDSNN